ncbi:transposase [Salmonella enterica]|uniref:Transposase n=1 Tax=Salmonella enterica subsp. enterica serovar Kisarawe TaxID=2517242 RepID=A0A5X8YSU5_SALET|nr:transposase [Salmonella enterica]EAB7210851.1 transposase [Salmonella enterica subsp. enterica serovar Cotham]EBH9883852.1 transposase [Salmonella enterica subsp. enterica serovar Kisarawe]EBV3374372.1 transposase [Salmonella enterica subsp. enterica serovar Senftenberg]EBW6020563.1 transposase [Salmonella enterica subsp. enterica serovar Infantis]EBX3951706.1 transposase [Salmonella enterica subsp. enterica serovar Offa]EBY0128045.1 transposase [Salmonella enterica subsp. enterica serovar
MARSAKPRKRKSGSATPVFPVIWLKPHDDEETGEGAPVLRFDEFDDAVIYCADLNIPFFVDDNDTNGDDSNLLI